MNNIYFSSEYFLEDVKFQIKTEYKNQSNFAKAIHYSRKALNRVLNSGDEITVWWIKVFCRNLNIKIEDYIYRRGV